jgi:hypothetical protein
MASADYDNEVLGFFNKLSGRLDVRLSEATQQIAEGMLNRAAPPSARIEEVLLSMRVFENPGFRDLTDEEWSRAVFRTPVIRLCGLAERVVEHRAPDGAAFTIRDLAEAIAETERQTRDGSEWFGGIDVHHVYFEGLMLDEDGVWSIAWGS